MAYSYRTDNALLTETHYQNGAYLARPPITRQDYDNCGNVHVKLKRIRIECSNESSWQGSTTELTTAGKPGLECMDTGFLYVRCSVAAGAEKRRSNCESEC